MNSLFQLIRNYMKRIHGLIRSHTMLLFIAAISLGMISCRGDIKRKSPVHPNMNMDQQKRMEAMEENKFFSDKRAMRTPVEGTVSRGKLKADKAYYSGMNEQGEYVDEIPHRITKEFVYRGKEKFEIFCSPCHGGVGDGQGIIMTGRYGYVPAPSFHTDLLRDAPDGQLYSAIANGVRNMPSYATQVDPKERWAIVAYIRALQESQYIEESEMAAYDVDLEELRREYDKEQQKIAEQQAANKKSGGGEVSAERGKTVYENNACQSCHSRDGSDGVGPTHQGIFGRQEELASGEEITVDEEYLYESIVEPTAKIVKGYQPVMQPYSYLSEDEINSLIEYLKTL